MSNCETKEQEKPQFSAPDNSRRRRRCVRVVAAIILWCVLFGVLVGSRHYTFSSAIVHDEGVFLYGGMALANGEVPYRDFWDHKPPGITLFHSIPICLFGYSILAVRLHEIFWLAISATILFYLCRAYLSAPIALLSVLFYCFFVSIKLIIRSGGLTEESALTFHALAYLFALRVRGSLRLNFFLSGLFLGVAAQFRQPFGISIIFIVLCLLWRQKDSLLPFLKKVRALVALALGAALPEALSSAYFLAKGIWPEYIEASYLFSFVYMVGSLDPDVLTFGAALQKHWRILQATGPFLISPALAAPLIWWLPARLRRVAVLMIVAFLCDAAAISLGGRYYEHYYLQVAISSSFLLGLAFRAMWEGVRPTRASARRRFEVPSAFRRLRTLTPASRLLCLLVGALVLRVCVVSAADAVKEYLRQYKAEMANRRQPSGELRAERDIGRAIRTVTKPGDRILLLGASPTSVYFAGQRLAGSRYYHLSPFFRKAFAESMRECHRQRLIADLKNRKPALIILAHEERQISFEGIGVVEKSAASFILPYLNENYVPLESFYRLSQIRRILGWTWYARTCSFLIRKDMIEAVKRRLGVEEKGPS